MIKLRMPSTDTHQIKEAMNHNTNFLVLLSLCIINLGSGAPFLKCALCDKRNFGGRTKSYCGNLSHLGFGNVGF